jgi:hypothetical protein
MDWACWRFWDGDMDMDMDIDGNAFKTFCLPNSFKKGLNALL